MQIGLFTPVFAKLSFDDLLQELKRYPQITMLELGTGSWPGQSHIDLDGLLESPERCREYRKRLRDAGLGISALSCHGNPVHPDQDRARKDDEVYRKTVRLAGLLEVPVVVTFSGCPGGGPGDQTPNWITAAWPPEYATALAWQWERCLIPYWQEAASFAADAGVKIALETHPGFSVYNPETLLRLRDAVGPSIGLNLDPSHLWWQGMDIARVIQSVGNAIFHVHAKDVYLNKAAIETNGVLDTKNYRDMLQRAWTFRSVGWGHGLLSWKEMLSTLRMVGYDYVVSIEHEDALASIHEGLSSAISTLSAALLTEQPVDGWWM